MNIATVLFSVLFVGVPLLIGGFFIVRYFGQSRASAGASGLIAGQALMGILIAATVVAGGGEAILPSIIKDGNPWLALIVFALLGWILIRIPAKSAAE